MAPRMPTFLVIGAAKSGTTSLYAHLRSHPDVFMSDVKEPNYFAFVDHKPSYRGITWRRLKSPPAVTDTGEYRRLFDAATTETALGEASVIYLYLPWCAGQIRRYLPETRLVVILRNPVERAFSQHQHAVRDGIEPLADFDAALDAEPQRVRDNWSPIYHYAVRGRYYDQLHRYYDVFEPDRNRVYLYDDYRKNPSAVVCDLYAFVGVDPTFTPDLDRTFNVSGVPKSRLLFDAYQKVVEAARRRASTPLAGRLLHGRLTAKLSSAAVSAMLAKRAMPERARERLREYYRDDVSKLEDLLGRDLSAWK
jgi:hypothetical protein